VDFCIQGAERPIQVGFYPGILRSFFIFILISIDPPISMHIDPQAFIHLMETIVPLHQYLGVKFLEVRNGYARLLIPFRPEWVGEPRGKRWHGGLIATALDSVGGAAAMTTLASFDDRVATIDMRVDYLRPSGPQDLVAEGEIIRNGNSVIVARMWACHPGNPDILAEGRAVFRVRRTVQPEDNDL
jgi:uncharacterized protein (TIGR00369 family)